MNNRVTTLSASEMWANFRSLNLILYFFQVVEWIKEKEPILKVKDIKNDEDSVLIYLKKINDILAEMEGYNKKIETIKAMSEKMIERSHFDSANIQTKMADLTDFHVNFKVTKYTVCYTLIFFVPVFLIFTNIETNQQKS